MFTEIMRYILDLGPTVMLPGVIIVFSLILGMKLGDSFKSAIHIGIGFVGIGLVIGLMLDSIGPAAKAMAEHFEINLQVVDNGWPGSRRIRRRHRACRKAARRPGSGVANNAAGHRKTRRRQC